ncbi:hypothetical protein BD408DRAFT_407680 [Parasitella parasitica]|nr:hypothetical protein BD408DRAFT_407680 [Parasitella parasitica]
MHYLSHISWIIRRQEPLVVYSTRSQERSIGRFSDLITGKVQTHKQASNLIETVAIRNFVKRTFDTNSHLQGICPPPYSSASFLDHPNPSNQLWEPFENHDFQNAALDETFENVTIRKIKKALAKFYRRLFSDDALAAPGALVFVVALRAWVNTIEIPCERYRKKIEEFRRGNHQVMFRSYHRHSINGRSIPHWFVGTILFFFEHTFQGERYFLAFVEVMKRHTVASHDKSIPVVYMNQSRLQQLAIGNERVIESKYAVTKIVDILLQVGLVQSLEDELKFSVIGSYHVFEQDMFVNAGNIAVLTQVAFEHLDVLGKNIFKMA